MGRARRLDGFNYIGRHAYFVTICTFEQVAWFRNDDVARHSTAQLVRTAGEYGFEIVAYCFMPDHLHALVRGVRRDANFRRFASMFKQRSAFEHSKRHSARLWQEGYFERILRSEDDIRGISSYILDNPRRAGLCDQTGKYPHLGSKDTTPTV